MPTQFDHNSRILRNCEFLIKTHQSMSFCEWSVTICFYTALHAINRYLASQDYLKDHLRHPRTHKATEHALYEVNFPEEDYLDYMTLYQASRIARYSPFHIFTRDYIDTNRITYLIDLALKLKKKYGEIKS